MTDIDKFHEWVKTQSPLALREYMFAQAAWQARGELDAVRIKELEAEIIGWQGKSIEREQHLQIANSAVDELTAKNKELEASREWQSLSDDEAIFCTAHTEEMPNNLSYKEQWLWFARAIDKALREKNNA